MVMDVEGDLLIYIWEIKFESIDLGDGGDYELELEVVVGFFGENINQVVV